MRSDEKDITEATEFLDTDVKDIIENPSPTISPYANENKAPPVSPKNVVTRIELLAEIESLREYIAKLEQIIFTRGK